MLSLVSRQVSFLTQSTGQLRIRCDPRDPGRHFGSSTFWLRPPFADPPIVPKERSGGPGGFQDVAILTVQKLFTLLDLCESCSLPPMWGMAKVPPAASLPQPQEHSHNWDSTQHPDRPTPSLPLGGCSWVCVPGGEGARGANNKKTSPTERQPLIG